MNRLKKFGLAGLLLIIALGLFLNGSSQAQDEAAKEVLILHSYHQGYKWTDDITVGIRSVLGDDDSINLQIEYMDTKRIADQAYLDQLLELYKQKFEDRQFDVIISSDNNAFDFLINYRDTLFPGTPVVFSGVNFFNESMLEGQDLFTGVNEDASIRGGFEIALQLHPETRQIVIVNDTTTTGQRIHQKLIEVIPAYQDEIDFVLLEDVTMAEIRQTVGELPPDSLVFYTLFFRDANGQFFEYDESISLITEVSAVPVYGTWDFSLGYGIVGGLLTSGFFQGEEAAAIAERILEGESADDIPVVLESPNRYMFDYQQLARWDIATSALPAGSIIINEPTSFFSRYRNLILGGAGAVVALIVFNAVLLTANYRRRQAELALQESNVELEAIRQTLEQRVQQRTQRLEQRAVQLEATTDITSVTTSVLDLEELLDKAVNLIRDRFDLYYVGLFLLNEDKSYAVLRAGTGLAGQEMLAQGHQLATNATSMIGQCIRLGEAQIALDVGQEAVRFDNPLLPKTRSELALPLLSRGQIIGALSVQSVEQAAFDQSDITILQTMANQVAVAISNARLFAETQEALEEMEQIQQRYLSEAWKSYTRDKRSTGYQRVNETIVPLSSDTSVEVQEALTKRKPVVVPAGKQQDDGDGASSTLIVPLILRDQPIGAVGFKHPRGGQNWNRDDINTAQALAEQLTLAADNLRLLEETQQRAARDRLVSDVSTQVRETLNIETILQTTVNELYERLGLEKVAVHLAADSDGGKEE
jgi:GAF domain-containing protein/ABC-type uncharacterized transport system substrate-binding protein